MLSEERYSRLLLLGTDTVEICHEQLITQWPWLQSRVTSDALDIRRLGRLIDKVSEWHSAEQKDKDQYLASGAELYLTISESNTGTGCRRPRPNTSSRIGRSTA
jgi:hypothetical protein